jgi:hypothetical protein
MAPDVVMRLQHQAESQFNPVLKVLHSVTAPALLLLLRFGTAAGA